MKGTEGSKTSQT